MAAGLNWHGDDFKRKMDQRINRNLQRASIEVKNEVKKAISEPSPPPSSSGEYPHKDTGRLRASISSKVEDKTAYVGTNVVYGKFLELGTRFMAARPFLRPTITKMQNRIKEIMKG